MRRLLAGWLMMFVFVGLGYAQKAPTVPHERAPKSAPKTPVVKLTAEESEILARLHAANEKEISVGTLAVERGQTADVRRFGRHLVDDHTAADLELERLAKKKSVTLQDSESSLLTTLRAVTDADFDETFVSTMVKEHDAAIALVKDAQRDCKDPDIVAYLEATLPVLERHREMAERMQNKPRS